MYPDDYYFLREYQIKILPCRLKNSILKSYEYIQYLDFKKPKDETVEHKDSLTLIYEKYYESFIKNYNEESDLDKKDI